MALVGARAASGNGQRLAARLAHELTCAGALVVSGGAVGIDAAAHEAALAAGGPTLAIVAPGLDAPYPARHAAAGGLYQRIVAGGGGVASLEPPGTPVQGWMFPKRNRVIAALADVTCVVECDVRSGSMSTARAAAELGRAVAVCEGSPGTAALAARGAHVLADARAILALAAGVAPAPAPVELVAGSPTARALAALSLTVPAAAEAVAAHTGLPVVASACALVELELMGLARPLPGARWVRATHAQHLEV